MEGNAGEGQQNVLQKHAAFFDRNHDGLIYPWETFKGTRKGTCIQHPERDLGSEKKLILLFLKVADRSNWLFLVFYSSLIGPLVSDRK